MISRIMIVTDPSSLPTIYIKYIYESDKVIKFNICYDNDKLLYISPDFSKSPSTEGIVCYGYNKGSIGISLSTDNIITKKFVQLINDVAKMVDESIKTDDNNFKLDTHPISSYTKDSVSKLALWCDVIQKKDNIFTKCYDIDNNKIDLKTLTSPSLVRPCICFRLSYSKSKREHRLRASISEMCVVSTTIPMPPRMIPNI